jgi:hypothetical protein
MRPRRSRTAASPIPPPFHAFTVPARRSTGTIRPQPLLQVGPLSGGEDNAECHRPGHASSVSHRSARASRFGLFRHPLVTSMHLLRHVCIFLSMIYVKVLPIGIKEPTLMGQDSRRRRQHRPSRVRRHGRRTAARPDHRSHRPARRRALSTVTVLCPQPTDLPACDRYHDKVPVPIAARMGGLVRWTVHRAEARDS